MRVVSPKFPFSTARLAALTCGNCQLLELPTNGTGKFKKWPFCQAQTGDFGSTIFNFEKQLGRNPIRHDNRPLCSLIIIDISLSVPVIRPWACLTTTTTALIPGQV
jgi:hypothetical protein